jgi:hypothetical protein
MFEACLNFGFDLVGSYRAHIFVPNVPDKDLKIIALDDKVLRQFVVWRPRGLKVKVDDSGEDEKKVRGRKNKMRSEPVEGEKTPGPVENVVPAEPGKSEESSTRLVKGRIRYYCETKTFNT